MGLGYTGIGVPDGWGSWGLGTLDGVPVVGDRGDYLSSCDVLKLLDVLKLSDLMVRSPISTLITHFDPNHPFRPYPEPGKYQKIVIFMGAA